MSEDYENRKRLKRLLEANDEPNRSEWALKAKKNGQKVVGITSTYVPEELIIAAGMLPWAITGTFKASLPLAWVHRPTYLNSYYSHALESILAGELDFLSGVVCTNIDDDGRRFYDVIAWSARYALPFLLFVPQANRQINIKYFASWIGKLKAALENLGNRTITEASLKQAIELCNNTRSLLKRVYELRKKAVLSGTEGLRLSLAARVMPKQEFNQEMEILLPYLESREVRIDKPKPRLLVSGDNLHDWRYFSLIENDIGALIAMDDLDFGSRYCWENCKKSGDDPIYSLAERYLSLPDFPGQGDWERQVNRVIRWVHEFDIDGVIQMLHGGLYPSEMRGPFYQKSFQEKNIRFMPVRIEYQFANVEQLRTRVGAFLEMLS